MEVWSRIDEGGHVDAVVGVSEIGGVSEEVGNAKMNDLRVVEV